MAGLRIIFAAAVALSAATASAQEVVFKDPTGDDNGPGKYVYPTDPVYKPGSFDLTQLKVKQAGDKVTFGLRTQLQGDGVSEGEVLEGNEESLTTYSDAVVINELAHAVKVRNKNRIDISGGKNLFSRSKCANVVLCGNGVRRRLVHIINGDQFGAGMSGDVSGVHAANPPAAENGNAEHMFLPTKIQCNDCCIKLRLSMIISRRRVSLNARAKAWDEPVAQGTLSPS